MRGLLALLALALVPLVGCADEGGSEPAATPPPVPSPSTETTIPVPDAPSPTQIPVATPTVTPTPSPEPVREPTPTFVPAILPTVAVPIPSPVILGRTFEKGLEAAGLKMNIIREMSLKEPVDQAIITSDEMKARFTQLFEESKEDIAKDQLLYTTLGIMAKGADLFQFLLDLNSEGTLGFFDTEAGKMFVVKSGDDPGPVEERSYVHEFIHVLQWQHFDTNATLTGLDDNTDGLRAYRALLEGDATLAEYSYILQNMSEEEQEQSEPDISEALDRTLRAAPRPVVLNFVFPYAQGLQFVGALFRANAWEAVNEAFVDPPQSTEQILHPEKYLSREPPVDVRAADVLSVLGEGWSEVSQDTLGEFFLLTYLATDTESQQAIDGAAGWGGDRYSLYEGPQGDAVLVLRLAWDTGEDGQQFFDTFVKSTEARTGAQWEMEGTSGTISTPAQAISIDLEGKTTKIVFAPSSGLLETVRKAAGDTQ